MSSLLQSHNSFHSGVISFLLSIQVNRTQAQSLKRPIPRIISPILEFVFDDQTLIFLVCYTGDYQAPHNKKGYYKTWPYTALVVVYATLFEFLHICFHFFSYIISRKLSVGELEFILYSNPFPSNCCRYLFIS